VQPKERIYEQNNRTDHGASGAGDGTTSRATSKIKLTARWQIGPETISGNTEWKMRLKKIQSTSKRLISTAGCLIFLALPQGALKGDTVDPADEKAIQERNETFVAAFNRGDIKAMAASYAPDCDFLSAEGQRVKGRDAMGKIFRQGLCGKQGAEAQAYAQLPPLPHTGRSDRRWRLGNNGPPRGKGVERTLYGDLDETRWAVVGRL
jgi:hypothetical protein